MFYKKEGFPEEGDVVLCTVKKILHNSVFASLDEYEDKEGLIHISEISPGRIRTLLDFVREGKKIICKVLRVNPERNHIDLSLRRVSDHMKIQKTRDHQQEIKAEKILEIIGKANKLSLEDMYKKVGFIIVEKYGSLYAGCQDIAENGESVLEELKVDPKIAKKLAETIKLSVKPTITKLTAMLSIKCSQPDGIDIIKSHLKKIIEHAKKKNHDLKIAYLGAPRYAFSLSSKEVKQAALLLEELNELAITSLKKVGCECEVLKKE